VRREPEFFDEQDLELVYIARRLSEAKALEALLTSASLDYLVEADQYFGGFLFRRVRTGAFFYVRPGAAEAARRLMETRGYRPYRTPG
jgi:hypothetical protein